MYAHAFIRLTHRQQWQPTKHRDSVPRRRYCSTRFSYVIRFTQLREMTLTASIVGSGAASTDVVYDRVAGNFPPVIRSICRYLNTVCEVVGRTKTDVFESDENA
jgi:hypothetical protein